MKPLISRENSQRWRFTTAANRMNLAHYRQLITDLCGLCGLAEPERIVEGGPVAVGDIAFSLIYKEQPAPGFVFIYCEFGDVPKGREADVYRALLEANMYLHYGAGPIFLVPRETGRVVLAERRPLDSLNPASLRDAMLSISEQARTWRADYFLDASQLLNTHHNTAVPRMHDIQRNYLGRQPKS